VRHRSAEYEAAYFTLLRARDELTSLLRYAEFLREERERLDAFADAVDDEPQVVARTYRKPVDATAKPVLEAVGLRRKAVLDELQRVPERITAAEEFVRECEEEVAALRG